MPELWDEAPGDVSAFSLPTDPKPAGREEAAPEAPSLDEGSSNSLAEEAADNAPDGRPRDEQGRFLPTNPEPQAEDEGTPISGELAEAVNRLVAEDPERYGGLAKFKTAEAVLRSYAHIEEHSGSLRNEVGELRALVEDRFERIQNQPPQPQFDLDEMIVENPAQAVELAWRSGNEAALRKALNGWDEIAPGMSAVWIENKQLAQKLQQIEQAQQPILQSNQEQQRLHVVAQAYADLEARYPDFNDHRAAMAEVAAEIAARNGSSFVDELLEQGTPEKVGEAFEYLYLKSRDRRGDNLSQVSQQLAREHVENTQRARQDALLASSSTTSGAAPKPDIAEAIADSWAKADAPYERGEGGWNI